MNHAPPDRIVLGITGATGAIYAYRLACELLRRGVELHCVASPAGRRVIAEELPHLRGTRETLFRDLPEGDFHVHSEKDFFAPFCSGSFRVKGVIIAPASMGTVGAVAAGYSGNAIHRAADVALKERTPLVVMARETPLSTVHLENLLRLSRAGAMVLPPMPAFYNHPETIADQVDFIVSRVLDALGYPNELVPRWGEPVNDGSPDS